MSWMWVKCDTVNTQNYCKLSFICSIFLDHSYDSLPFANITFLNLHVFVVEKYLCISYLNLCNTEINSLLKQCFIFKQQRHVNHLIKKHVCITLYVQSVGIKMTRWNWWKTKSIFLSKKDLPRHVGEKITKIKKDINIQ